MLRRPRQMLLAISGSLAVATTMLAGCTFLIAFDDVPTPSESGLEIDRQVPPLGPPDVTTDTRMNVPDASPDVRDAANLDACKGHPNGKYCGGNQIVWPPDRKDDLVTCKTDAVSGVRFCAAGVGCISNVPGYPDECDECAKKADGTYCGRDMAGWDPLNANVRVRCGNGREVGLLLCAAPGCNSNGAASACK